MSTAICFILDQSKILSSGNGLLCHALPLANRCYKKICIEPIKKPEENHTVSILSNYIADLFFAIFQIFWIDYSTTWFSRLCAKMEFIDP